MIRILFAILSMAFADACSTFLTIASNRGRTWLAGSMDALRGLGGIFLTIFGAGEVIKHGWTTHTILVIVFITLTSFFGTALWTRLGQKIGQKDQIYGTRTS